MLVTCMVGAVYSLFKGETQNILNFMFAGYMNIANIRDNQNYESRKQLENRLDVLEEGFIKIVELIVKGDKDI